MALLLALTSAAAYGAADFFGGLSARRLPSAAVVLRAHVVGLLGMIVALPLVGDAGLTGRDATIGALGGIAGAIGVLLLYRGLAIGTMSVVAPITAVLSAVVPVTAGMAGGDRPAALALLGVPLALVAIALLSGSAGGGRSRAGLSVAELVSAVGAGLGFGLFFVALDQAGDDAGLWPVVTGRVASVALFLLVAGLSAGARIGGPAARLGTTPALLVGCGLLDAAANALFLLATHSGMLTLVAVIAALYPASTLLLARGVLGERLTSPQRVGVIVAATAVVLVTTG
jgi:uncharacterized membrane protein